MRTSLLILLAACSDYAVKGADDGPVGFDSGDSYDPTEETGDTAPPDSDTSDRACAERSYDPQAIAQDETCQSVPSTGSFTPELEWKWDTFTVEPSSNNVMATPIVVSLTDDDGDGAIDEHDTPDIVFVTYTGEDWSDAGVIRAVSGDGTASLFDITGQGIDGCSGLAAGDLDGDGRVEIVAVTTTKVVKAFDVDGNLAWTSAGLSSDVTGYAPTPAISDMDGDGSPEIIVGRVILDASGSVVGRGNAGQGGTFYGTTSFAVDLDGDGQQEVVTGNAAYDIDGATLWSNGHSDGYVAVADMDADGEGEIVVVADGAVRLQETDGSVSWTQPIPGALSSFGGPPTIADFDGDGEPEIGVAANSTYSVFETDGTLLWQSPTQDISSGVTGSAVFDFEGDGVAEAIYADETRIWAFNGPDGSVKLESTDHTNWTVIEYPVIADVDGDDEAEIVVPNGQNPSYSFAQHGISVLGDADHSWRSGRRIWNQHAYHITNVNDDGSIPRVADQNWRSYNNFRSGDISALAGSEAPDLVASIVDVCGDECADDRLLVWVRVGNPGYSDVTDPGELVITAQTGAGEVELYRQALTDTIVAGQTTAGIELALTGLPEGTITALGARIDANDGLAECHEDNNTDAWVDVVCL